MATNPMRITADDLLDIEVPSHLRGYELANGRLVDVTPVSLAHGCVAAEMAFLLSTYVREHGMAGYVSVESGYVLRLPRDRYGAQGGPHRHRETEVLDGGDVLPGLRVPLKQVFDRIPPGL